MSPARLTQLMKAVTPSGCVITEPFQLQDWNFFPEICHTAWHNLRLVLQSKFDPKYYPQRANVCWAYEIFCDIYDKNATFCDKTLFCILASKEEYIYQVRYHQRELILIVKNIEQSFVLKLAHQSAPRGAWAIPYCSADSFARWRKQKYSSSATFCISY